MNVSKVGNQTSSQDPQAVNSRLKIIDDLNLYFNPNFQGFCWESQHVPNSEDWRGENLPEVWEDRWDFYA